ncbi:carboxypeptidase-like regulatory domain-containing protein [Pedobacter sp. JY14-1]|uniref:carboxypeptidase-like regulatory domain-containing protein n=1 Tax=Pedobacter sp. JY14-1 TaxID=3034151 RepID=UPI0023E0EA4A|nr:carboxypeptidase-like regulatory domain-containing protein [Pedobacter sp. JY14-1]
MKNLVLIFLCLFASAFGAGAQKITLRQQQAALQSVFQEIRRQSGYDFLYNEQTMKYVKPVNINVKNASIEQALDSALSGSSLKYAIFDKLVTVVRKDTLRPAAVSYTLQGTVKDRMGNPLPGASVYISNYKLGASADNSGRYMVSGLSSGSYVVLAQMMGYQPASQGIVVNNKPLHLDIVMDESVKELSEVVVRPDIHRAERLRTFRESFLGTSENARKCKIINPDVIRFDYDISRHVLMATADDFLVIENNALGYRVYYLLEYFEHNEETSYVHFYGYPYFEEMEKDETRRRRYQKKRRLAYAGSPQHFFSTLYRNTSKIEGFLVNKMIKAPNPERPSDEFIDKRIKLFSENLRKGIKVRRAKDSLKYWLGKKQLPDTVELLVRREVSLDSLVSQRSDHQKMMRFSDALYIVYQNEKETADFMRHPEYRIKRPGDLGRSQVSLAYQLGKSVGFYENGGLNDPGALLYEGIWAYKMVGDMLPLDYSLPDD